MNKFKNRINYCLFFSTLLSKPSGTGNCVGRSMIEMLGVLAIISVLSVGGIAGYSKAMEKWKINKTVEGYSYLITGLLEYIDDFRPLQHDNGTENDDFRYYLGNVIQGLNLVPEGWKVNSSGVFDTLGNYIAVFTRREKIVFDIHLGTTENVNQSTASMDFSDKICFELLNTAFQPLHSMLYKVFIFKSKTGSISYYGDGYCAANQKCLRTLTMPEMKQVCQSCVLGDDFCLLTVEF